MRGVFGSNRAVAEIADARQGLATADNGRFLRFWYEVNFSRIRFGCSDRNEAIGSNAKWFPYNKGGALKKWYGNQQ